MRKFLLLIVLLVSASALMAQAPGFFNYQGVARNSVGNALVNQAITLRLTIHDGSASGPVVYSETRAVTTNAFGLFNVQVGGAGASQTTGSVSGAAWYLGTKWMQVEIDPAGGNNLKDIGSTQLTSVPYALFSKQSGDMVLPYNKSQADGGSLFSLNNTGTAANSIGVEGISGSTAANASGVRGVISSTSPGAFSAGVLGRNSGTGGNGVGVYGSQNGSGWGVYGTTPSGIGVRGESNSGAGVAGQSQSSTGVFGVSGTGTGVAGNSNTGNAAQFFNTNSANSAATVSVTNNGSGDGVSVSNSGTGRSGFFQNTNASNTAATLATTSNGGDAFQSVQTGTGKAGVFSISNASALNTTVDISTDGLGKSLLVQNNNTANTSSVMEMNTAGTGRIAWLRNTNAANPSNLFDLSSNGTGRLAILQNTNAANSSNLVDLISNGRGKLLSLQNTGATNSSNILDVLNNGTGKTAVFQISNAASAANVLDVNSNGTGYAALIRNSNASPKALRTEGAIQFTGVGEANNKLLASDATGNATWVLPAAIGATTGTGTNNFITKWTPNTTNLGVSQLFDDGNKIAFAGAVDPFYKVDVNGTFKVNASATDTAVAIFENTSSSSKGDGIIIKIGRTHPRWNGSAYANVPNLATQGLNTQMNQIRDWIYGNDQFSWDDLVNIIPSQYLAKSFCQISNYITSNLNNALNLPIHLGPLSTPSWSSGDIFSWGGYTLSMPPGIPDIHIGGFTIPGITIPSLNVLPQQITVVPTIPQIPCSNLPTIAWPTFVFNDVNNTLSKDNEFISFVDKDNRKLGAIRAQSIQNFSYDYFDAQKILEIGAQLIGLDIAKDFMGLYAGVSGMINDYNNIGVEYSSGNGDYAEWLERSNPAEHISYGDIVGVRGGKITKDLTGAEQIMAVSKQPIVLGNIPDKSKLNNGNNIAFMGQIPVKVTGPVRGGDYIVARNDIPGYGVAIHPADMKIEDFKLAVGRSWDTNEKEGPKMVNTVVGVHNHDFLNIISALQFKAAQTDERLKAIEAQLQQSSNTNTEKPKKAFR